MGQKIINETKRMRELMSHNITYNGKPLLTENVASWVKIFIGTARLMSKVDATWAKQLDKVLSYELKMINKVKILDEMVKLDGLKASERNILMVLSDLDAGKSTKYTGRGAAEKNRIAKWMKDNPRRWHKTVEDKNISKAGKQQIFKAVSNDATFQNMYQDYIMKHYEPRWNLFPAEDDVWKFGRFIELVQYNTDFRKFFDEDFLKMIDEAMESIHGVRKSLRKRIAAWTLTKFNPTGYADRIDGIMRGVKPWGATFKHSIARRLVKLRGHLSGGIKGFTKYVFKLMFGSKIRGFVGRVIGVALLFYVIQWMRNNLSDIASIMNMPLGEDNLWQTLPPDMKRYYGLPQSEAKERAQKIYTELYDTKTWGIDFAVKEGKIMTQLTKEPTSYLIIGQIAYEFMMIPDNKSNKTLYAALDEKLTNIIDYVGTYIQDKTGWEWGTYTVQDIVRKIEEDPNIAMYEATPEFKDKLKTYQSTLLTDVAKMRQHRVYSPQAIENGDYGLYNIRGRYMGPNLLAVITTVLDEQGADNDWESWYSSPDEFKFQLRQTNRDTWEPYKHLVNASIEGTINSKGRFVPKEEPPGDYDLDNSADINQKWDKIRDGIQEYTDKMVKPIEKSEDDD